MNSADALDLNNKVRYVRSLVAESTQWGITLQLLKTFHVAHVLPILEQYGESLEFAVNGSERRDALVYARNLENLIKQLQEKQDG